MRIELGYANASVALEVPDENVQAVLTPRTPDVGADEAALVRRSLENPIGSARLRDLVRPGQTVAVVTSDVTRPMPSHKVLGAVIDELNSGGVRDEDILVVFALGSHRKHTDAEKRALVGAQVYERVRLIDSDADDCVTLGHSAQGTPVDIFVPVARADVRVLLGNIEYHYFAGYSGGAKALMPGVSSRRAIGHNHRNMVLPAACAGRIDGNPIRADIEDALRFIPADFILNVVLDERKRIIHSVAGDVIAAHRAGCALLDGVYAAPIDALADCVVVSPGGYPKDINLYQAQKALDNARLAVKEGGEIIWVASCREGYGEAVFEAWLRRYENPKDCVAAIKRDFELGGHKAAAIAMTALRARISLVSDLDEETSRRTYCEKLPDVNTALERVLARNPNARILVMPFGGSTLPKVTLG